MSSVKALIMSPRPAPAWQRSIKAKYCIPNRSMPS